MKVLPAITALTLSAAMTIPAAAQEVELAASNPWTLDYADDSCALRRMFGAGDRQAFLELRRFARGPRLQATVTTSWMRARNPASVRFRFGEEAEWSDSIPAVTLRMAKDFTGVLFFADLIDLHALEEREKPTVLPLPADWLALERAAALRASTFAVRGAFGSTAVLQTGPLAEPMDALNQCIDELMTHWDIDVEAHKTLTRPAVPVNLPEVPRMIDYPPAMLEQRMPGVVNIRLSIDETGRITGCHIQMPLSDPAFEETSCADIQHALEFEPALDKDGQPIASYYVTPVVFQIAQ